MLISSRKKALFDDRAISVKTQYNVLAKLAIVVPVRPGDATWQALAHDFSMLPAGAELIFVGPKPPTLNSLEKAANLCGTRLRISWVKSPLGRGTQLNRGATATQQPYIWFLHADSRLAKDSLKALGDKIQELSRSPNKEDEELSYFDLDFHDRAQRLDLWLTELGALFRSRILRLPFGDQGFLMSRRLWERLGGFPETAPYGEDHLLVWRAHQAGIRVRPIGATLLTSARKYRQNGWWQTTSQHFWLTWKQAAPELWKLLQSKRTAS